MRHALAAIARASALFVVVGLAGALGAGLVLLLIFLLRLATGEPPV